MILLFNKSHKRLQPSVVLIWHEYRRWWIARARIAVRHGKLEDARKYVAAASTTAHSVPAAFARPFARARLE
jgi:hypothetical protein